MPVLLDASFLIAFDNTDDVHNTRSRELWELIRERGGAFVSDYVFDEVMSVTMRKKGKERANRLGQHILDSIPVVTIDRHIFDQAWKQFSQSKLSLSFTDWTCIGVLNLIETKTIATFDKEFKKLPGVTVLD